MHKVRKNNLSESMTSMFKMSNNTNYSPRGNEVIFDIQKPNTNFMKQSISYLWAAMLWTRLQKSAKEKQI